MKARIARNVDGLDTVLYNKVGVRVIGRVVTRVCCAIVASNTAADPSNADPARRWLRSSASTSTSGKRLCWPQGVAARTRPWTSPIN